MITHQITGERMNPIVKVLIIFTMLLAVPGCCNKLDEIALLNADIAALQKKNTALQLRVAQLEKQLKQKQNNINKMFD